MGTERPIQHHLEARVDEHSREVHDCAIGADGQFAQITDSGGLTISNSRGRKLLKTCLVP